ncbi:MAG: phosphoglucomutase/phosphomannomutase family protein [Blastocatellia bacterium]|nr:phosphoglucomutase/phosphomannomutase family protein [Blastocatellia bacterium]
MPMITFGTSGWRAIIAEDFTFANVRLVTHAIADVLTDLATGNGVIVSYDPRFMAEKFAALSSDVLASRGFPVVLTVRDTPTPTIAVTIRARGLAGAINFTASHNPPEYCGMKFSTADGAPALPEITKRVEERIRVRSVSETESVAGTEQAAISQEDLREAYLTELLTKVDTDVLKRVRPKIAYDALWGTGRGYLDAFLRDCGCEVAVLHDWRDPYFGGASPEPSPQNLRELCAKVTGGSFTLGLSTDGDADRFGIVDADGTCIAANDVLALLADYLIESRGWTGGIGRSVATTHLLDRVAAHHNRAVFETPVGFKFLGELILADKIILGGEESAGLSIKGHIPEKDGILACLLVAEMVAARGKTMGTMLAELHQTVGSIQNKRIGVRLTPEIKERFQKKLASEPPAELGGKKVVEINRTDGVKYLLEDHAWMLVRLSGTEPLARCYAEAQTESELEVLLESGRNFILS